MDKLLEIGILYEFYGALLNKKQATVIECFYLEDYSLNEIADNIGVSKQAVFETLQRSEKKLVEMEKALHLVEKYYSVEKKIKQCIEWIDKIETNEENRARLQSVRKMIEELQ